MEVLSSLFSPFSQVFVTLGSSSRTGRHFPLRIQLQASPAALPWASLPSLAWAPQHSSHRTGLGLDSHLSSVLGEMQREPPLLPVGASGRCECAQVHTARGSS